MNYEKGAARNLVQFSEYPDVAFTDTGLTIDDNSKPNKNVIWSSDRITEYVNNVIRSPQAQQPQYYQPPPPQQQQPQISYRTEPVEKTSWVKEDYGTYPNGYRKYYAPNKLHAPRVIRPSWWMSWIIPSRQHYCDKCCNYLDHKWSSKWKDNPELANNKCSCNSKCGMTNSPKRQRQLHTHTITH